MEVVVDKRLVQVWNVSLTDGRKIRAATIEQGPRKPSMCQGCPAPCCQGIFRPILNSEEFLSKKFPTMYMDVPDWLKDKVPRAQKVAVLAFSKPKPRELAKSSEPYCDYFDPISHKCTIFPNCPKGCLAYDCREDNRPEIQEFAEKREKEWQAQLKH